MRSLRILTSIAVVSTLLATSGIALGSGTKAYRWKDDQGVTQLSAQPPLGREYEEVQISSGKSSAPTPVPATRTDADPQAAGSAEDQLVLKQKKDPKVCEQARQNLETLQENSARIRMRDSYGNERMLTEEEVAEQRKRAEQAISTHCD